MDSETRQRGGRSGDDKPSTEGRDYQTTDETKIRSSKGRCAFVVGVTTLCVLLVAVIIILLPCPIEPQAFSLPPPPEWTGPLAPNDKLSKAQRIFENQLRGPESIVKDGEFMYTGTADGKVVSINRGEIYTLATFGNGTDCGSFDSEPTCGRPLGMRMDKDGYLLVADAYLGIYRVNVATGDFHQVLSSQSPLAGQRPRLLNDLEEGPGGILYFTDSSTRWGRRHNRYCIMEGQASGRLLSYDPESMHVEELVSGLAFANGVAISYDKTHILVAETSRARIWRYYLTGPRQGEVEVFADNLPGLPDNIRRSGHGTYWVGMAAIRRSGKLSFMDLSAPYPWLRALIAKLVSQERLMSLVPSYGLAVEISKDGQIVRTLHDPTGAHVPVVSEVEEKDGVLYIGSYDLPFITRLYLHGK